jgi:hypothetical protein
MNSKDLFVVFLLLGFTPAVICGQSPSAKKWELHISYIKTQYPDLPAQHLDSITVYLDSSAIGSQCYRFIPNADKTKFIAFYLTDRNSGSFLSIKRDYGGTYRSYTWGEKKEDQTEVFAYTVTGMFYKGQWYYSVGEYVEFFADGIEEAKNIFLIRNLFETNFFVRNTSKKDKAFWTKNVFAKNTYPYKKDYPNTPEVVVKATLGKNVRRNHNQNKNLERLACEVSTGLWHHLQNLDSTRYHSRYKGRYMESYCLSLYNSKRNTVLLPIIYFNTSGKANLKYYVLKISATDTTLYDWKRIGEKEVNREKSQEGLEVVYDIRNFINNWGWGTVNMISDDGFWDNNFGKNDIEVSAYQFYGR